MGDRLRRLLFVAGLLAVCATLAACARPTGDFGRASPSYLHDEVMPAAGRARARASGEPVSRFNHSDDEREMHDRIWRFLVAPHARDWFMDTAVELQRTRIAGTGTVRFKTGSYYDWLHHRDYASSRIRFRTLADHAKSDIDTAPATFDAICRVHEMDRRRGIASHDLRGISGADVAARRAENDAAIGWFARALRYRYDAYAYALDHLLVETPHPEAVEVDRRLGELAAYVEAAERGDFCSTQAHARADHRQAIPSRVLMQEQRETGYRK